MLIFGGRGAAFIAFADVGDEKKLEMKSEFFQQRPRLPLDVDTLTPYAVETRYPGYSEEITEHDVEHAIKLADKVLKWAGEYITRI